VSGPSNSPFHKQEFPPETTAPVYASVSMQDYFNKTIRHLVDQKKRAVTKGGSCVFLIDGLKCAVGCHIPDGHEAQNSQLGVSTLKITHPELAGIAWPNEDLGVHLAAGLQHLHDVWAHWDKDGFVAFDVARRVAERFKLRPDIVDILELAERDRRAE